MKPAEPLASDVTPRENSTHSFLFAIDRTLNAANSAVDVTFDGGLVKPIIGVAFPS